jgi:cell division protease FtsH
MRAGRFDRQIFVDLPYSVSVQKYLKFTLLWKSGRIGYWLLAKQTPGFSGADIANVCNEEALIAARNNKTAVDKTRFRRCR